MEISKRSHDMKTAMIMTVALLPLAAAAAPRQIDYWGTEFYMTDSGVTASYRRGSFLLDTLLGSETFYTPGKTTLDVETGTELYDYIFGRPEFAGALITKGNNLGFLDEGRPVTPTTLEATATRLKNLWGIVIGRVRMIDVFSTVAPATCRG